MNLNNLKNIYSFSPLWLKKAFSLLPAEFKYGREYKRWELFLKESEPQNYAFNRLKQILFISWENIPFYRESWAKVDFNPRDFTDTGQLSQLPFIDKDIVRENFQRLLNPNISNKRRFRVSTGGSSGRQMEFIQSSNVWWKELAFFHSIILEYGYKNRMRKASFRGGEFPGRFSYFSENPIHNELCFSPFHLSKKTVSKYVERLKREKIEFLHCYPSAIVNLMSLMKVGGYSLDRPLKAIFLISENFTQSQANELERFFSCKVMSFYGHSERLIIAPSYGVTTNYRVDQRYGFFELIGKDGEAITTNTVEGEMVGTSFDNYAMPLIRYRTGDHTSFVDIDNQVVSGVAGRWGQDVLLGLNNEEVTLTALNIHSDVFSNVTNYQFFQKHKGKVTIRVLPGVGFSPECEQAILKAHQVKVNGVITFSIEKVDRLKTSVRGKYLRVVNS